MQNPFIERMNAIIEWKKIAAEKIEGTKNVVARASEFTRNGVKSKDALHMACAIEGKAEYEACFKMLNLYTTSRRQDMTIVAAAQAAVLAIVARNILNFELHHFLLSLVALFVTLMGLNSDRRHSAYMKGYIKSSSN